MLPGQNDLTSEIDIVAYLIDDIAHLPIISNRAQELWLGVQIRAAQRSIGYTPRAALAALAQAHIHLIDTADDAWAERIDIGRWADELQAARRNIYALRHSRLRRLLDWLPAEDAADSPHALLHETVEWLALLPDDLLHHLVRAAGAPAIDWDALGSHAPDMAPHDYAAWAAQQARRARDQLVTGYLRYALRLARNAVGGGLDFPDLAQHGFLGLMRAAERFDYRVNARFGTYASSWIWQSIGRALVDEGQLIRLPVHIHERLNRLARLAAQRDTGHGDPLRDPALLAEAGFAEERAEQVARLVLQTQGLLPLDAVVADGDAPDDAVDLAHEPPAEPESDAEALRSAVDRALAHLTSRQREVLELRYGLADGEERTLEEVGRHYGVTRERARQIEAAAMRTLDNRWRSRTLGVSPRILDNGPPWSIARPPLPPVYPVELLTAGAPDDGDWAWLDARLARLPHSDWHANRARHAIIEGGRAGQLRAALLMLGGPAHFTHIIEAANTAAPSVAALEETTGYNTLIAGERLFLLLGEGVFSLVEWEQARAAQPQPRLPCCPLPPPDPPDLADGLFESLFVGRHFLATQPTATEFVAHLLRWAGADPLPKTWLRQGILATYYLLGLIPYVCIAGGDNPRLRSTLPDESVHALRRHCLRTVTERLADMPQFWMVLQRAQAARPIDMGELFAEFRPDGPDDSLQRLAILRSLGAVERLANGRYRLTALGRVCIAEWAAAAIEPGDADQPVGEFDGDLLTWTLL